MLIRKPINETPTRCESCGSKIKDLLKSIKIESKNEILYFCDWDCHSAYFGIIEDDEEVQEEDIMKTFLSQAAYAISVTSAEAVSGPSVYECLRFLQPKSDDVIMLAFNPKIAYQYLQGCPGFSLAIASEVSVDENDVETTQITQEDTNITDKLLDTSTDYQDNIDVAISLGMKLPSLEASKEECNEYFPAIIKSLGIAPTNWTAELNEERTAYSVYVEDILIGLIPTFEAWSVDRKLASNSDCLKNFPKPTASIKRKAANIKVSDVKETVKKFTR